MGTEGIAPIRAGIQSRVLLAFPLGLQACRISWRGPRNWTGRHIYLCSESVPGKATFADSRVGQKSGEVVYRPKSIVQAPRRDQHLLGNRVGKAILSRTHQKVQKVCLSELNSSHLGFTFKLHQIHPGNASIQYALTKLHLSLLAILS